MTIENVSRPLFNCLRTSSNFSYWYWSSWNVKVLLIIKLHIASQRIIFHVPDVYYLNIHTSLAISIYPLTFRLGITIRGIVGEYVKELDKCGLFRLDFGGALTTLCVSLFLVTVGKWDAILTCFFIFGWITTVTFLFIFLLSPNRYKKKVFREGYVISHWL